MWIILNLLEHILTVERKSKVAINWIVYNRDISKIWHPTSLGCHVMDMGPVYVAMLNILVKCKSR
jgi:hypothetical protein